MQNLQNELKTPSEKQGTRVRIPWTKSDTSYKWNDVCAWALEEYGLPGDKYHTHSTVDFMDFYFYDERHAIHFNLRWL